MDSSFTDQNTNKQTYSKIETIFVNNNQECGENQDVADQIYSQQDQSGYNRKQQLLQNGKQQLQGHLGSRQKGQSSTLQPIQIQSSQQITQNTQQKALSTQSIQQTNPVQQKTKPKSKQIPKELDRPLICRAMNIDSKFLFGAYFLYKKQLKQLLLPKQGFIRINPYINNKTILIYYYDQKKIQQIENKIDELINSIEMIEMGKKQAESGVQLSIKYIQNLQKQNIAIFKDNTLTFKTEGYYICGRVKKQILYHKLSELRKVSFGWLHLYKFQNTRSYRAILRKIFDTPEVKQFFMQKFKAKQVQVGNFHSDLNVFNHKRKQPVLIVITYVNQKKLSIHQQIQQTLTKQIQQNFVVFCFAFRINKQNYILRYTPKVNKVIWFFITQKNTKIAMYYLYIIVNRKDFYDVRDIIIEEIQKMKLQIKGRRVFKNLSPQIHQIEDRFDYYQSYYPKSSPYSWTLLPKRYQIFNWKAQLKI